MKRTGRYIINKEKVLEDYPTLSAFQKKYCINWMAIQYGLDKISHYKIPRKYWIKNQTKKKNVVFIEKASITTKQENATHILTTDSDGKLRLKKC